MDLAVGQQMQNVDNTDTVVDTVIVASGIAVAPDDKDAAAAVDDDGDDVVVVSAAFVGTAVVGGVDVVVG